MQVGAHNGSSWDTQAQMDYNGLGQRLSMDAAGVIAHYVMDGDLPLTATSNGNTNYYLYGLGAIAEKTDAWNYSLPDGTNTPRQLSNLTGGITLTARYTPWGDALDTYGTGNFTFGYFGGVMDAATGLLYVGNGQYYDPATGRFLTRDAKPNNSNPYVPWDPTGAIIGPLAAVALFFGKRKRGSKIGTFFILLLVVGSVGMTLAACQTTTSGYEVTVTPTRPNTYNVEITPTTIPGSTPTSTGTPMPTITATCTVTPTPASTPTLPSLTGSTLDAYIHAYNTYVALKYHAGWWNNNDTEGKMTSLDFLEVLLSIEFSGVVMNSVPQDLVYETVVRNFYAKCKDFTGHPCSPHSDADILTYIAKKDMLEARPGYIMPEGGNPASNPHWKEEKPTRSKLDYSSVILSHDPLWERSTVDEPIDWGNLSIMLLEAMYAPIGRRTNEVVFRAGNAGDSDPMFILTACQLNHWGAPPPVGYGQDYDYGINFCREPKNWTKK